jgi:putative oxidoreductase
MIKVNDSLYTLVGRILLGVLFLPAGLMKLTGFAGTAGYIASAGLPLPEVGAALAIIIEIGGGAALIAGYRTVLAAQVLAVFTLVATVCFHNFWAMPADQAFVQQLMFFKNIAVVGGLLVLAAHGAGAWSLDGKAHADDHPLAHDHVHE